MKPPRALLALASAAALLAVGVAHDEPIASASVTTPRPERVLDSRTGIGGIAGRLQPGRTVRLQLPVVDGAVALNLTATDAASAGNLRMWACDDARPATSNVNFLPGRAVANLTVVAVDEGGVCLSATAGVHVVADLTAVFGDDADIDVGPPHRLMDTRASGERLRAGTTTRIRIAGTPGIPSDTPAAVVNFTVVSPAANGYLTAFPCNSSTSTGAPPDASTLNYSAGQTTAATTFAQLGAGDVCVFSYRDLDLVVDTFGSVPAGSPIDGVPPERLLDTRDPSSGPARSGQTIRLGVAGRSGVPDDAAAAIVTLGATDATSRGYVTAWPCDQPRPLASALNFVPGAVRANTVVVGLSHDTGEACLYARTADGSSVHLVADIVGFVDGGAESAPSGPTTASTERFTSRFTTLPPGSALPSGAECASRVRPTPEVRPGNTAANNTRGSRATANNRDEWGGFDRVDGDFTGTTDEIIQWAACKWGIDEDMARAQVVKESWWRQSTNGDNGESWGLGQVKDTFHAWAFEYSVNARTSSAYNLDYTYASWRACFEGVYSWLNTVERGATYRPGDAWGCMGVWFSGRWYTQPAVNYLEGGDTDGYGATGVKQHYSRRTWTDPAFVSG